MTFLTLLSNSILPAAITPLFTVFIPVVMGWILGFIPAEQKKAKWGTSLKLVVESAAFAFVFSKSPKGPDTESIGPLYVVVLVGLSGMMVADIVQMLTTTELDEARWQDNRKGLMDKVRVTWIDGGLKKSLKEQTRISVRLE